ncbi:hypothetical protein VOLCADRAFT_97649 [Volvox carteri f. nagariensis]|uniref:Uncharacterized protein n=1 Tax=Volvox carteri f. nagariensis TaxID=3068 RepID=D8UD97_VOLCA|nr:uncharacterized protein VOLCADRAFT_97649 [Volvox carteri f. nagariensis]EFJ42271.1 hypothetical protein VOLCADRAFT_97649 [Volvox carteri f. nagariensis]|eukprot:XP_002956669.1 hypothetical protein VOLCADRAFT_97649 [Volvox carteri f. nagariensis]
MPLFFPQKPEGPLQDATSPTAGTTASNTNCNGEDKEEADNPVCTLCALSTTSHASTAYFSAGGWSQFGEDGEWLGGRPPSALLMSGAHGDLLPSVDLPPPPAGINHHLQRHPHPHQVHQHSTAPSPAVLNNGAIAGSSEGMQHGDALGALLGTESLAAQHHHHHPAMSTTTTSTTASTIAGQECHERGRTRGQHPPPPAPLPLPLQQDYLQQIQQKHQSQHSSTPPSGSAVQPAATTLMVAAVQEQATTTSPASPQNCRDQDTGDNVKNGNEERIHHHQHHHQMGCLSCCSGDVNDSIMPAVAATAALFHGDDKAGADLAVSARGTDNFDAEVPPGIAAAREDVAGSGVHGHVDPVLNLVSELYAAQGRPCCACQVLLRYCKAQGMAPESLREELRARELPNAEALTKVWGWGPSEVAQGISDCLSDLASDQGWQLVRNDDLQLLYKPLPSQGVHAFRGRFVVDAPLEHMMALLREVDLCPTWNKYCSSAYVLRELSPADILAYMSLWVPWPLNDVGFMVEAQGADLFEEEGRLVVCFKSPERQQATGNSSISTGTAATATTTAASAASTPGRGGSPHPTSSSPPPPPPLLPPLPPGAERHRRIRLLARSCMVFEPLPPRVPGGQPRTRCAAQVYVDPGIRLVPPFIISFVLKVLSPVMYAAVLKVMATAFKSPNNPLPKRIQERAYLYGLVQRRAEAYLRSKSAAALGKQADGVH